MTKVVRLTGEDPEAHFVVLDTDSSGTVARLVSADAYVPGRAVQDYDHEDLLQLDFDGLEEVEDVQTVWAIFCNEEEGYSTRISAWMPRQEADDRLTGLLENGEWCVYLVSKEV